MKLTEHAAVCFLGMMFIVLSWWVEGSWLCYVAGMLLFTIGYAPWWED